MESLRGGGAGLVQVPWDTLIRRSLEATCVQYKAEGTNGP